MESQALENRIKTLETMLTQAKQDADQMSKELSSARVTLEKINLPKITKETVNEIRDAIDQVIAHYDFNTPDSYSYGFEIGYDNTIELNSIEFECMEDLSESISNSVEYLFNVIED